MKSKVLDGKEVAMSSVSNTHLDKTKQKGRPQYSLPSCPSQLNDRAARRADNTLVDQFYKSSRSITPPPGSTNWAPKNNLLVTMDGTTMAKRLGGSRKDRNVVAFGETAPTTLRVSTGHGGEKQIRLMVKQLVESGSFDEEVMEYSRRRILGPIQNPQHTVKFVENAQSAVEERNDLQAERMFAGRQRSADDIANDNNIGSVRTEVDSFDDIGAIC